MKKSIIYIKLKYFPFIVNSKSENASDGGHFDNRGEGFSIVNTIFLIVTFGNLNIGGGGSAEQATQAAGGIGEALITTAGGMVVAILALLIFRVLVALQSQQIDYFSEVGSELELIYRQVWYEPSLAQPNGRDRVDEEVASR